MRRTALEIARDVSAGSLDPVAVTAAALDRIAALDNRLNAVITVNEHARDAAASLKTTAADRSDPTSRPLLGVPILIKDLTDTAGLRTTYGSALYKDNVPTQDDLVVARLKAAGAIIVGKSMTPEFGFGAICANALKSPTCNPWNTALTTGGSSGGAAAAVAAGYVPIAHGTDFGGSVRTPASFCGTLSLRPTPGLIPSPRRALAFDTLASHGALATSVADLRLFLTAVAGPDPLDPTSRPLHASDPCSRPSDRPLRLAITEDFGVAPVSAAVRCAFRHAVTKAAPLGPTTSAHPDCSGAIPAFHTLRQAIIRHSYGALLDTHSEHLSATVRWAIGQGAGITASNFLAAETRHSRLYRDFVTFFDTYDVLLAPAAAVLPWPNTRPDVMDIDGTPLPTVIDYLAITFLVSMAGCPVITLPAWTAADIPFGVQLIGAPGTDLALLDIAERFEQTAGFAFRPPPDFA